MVYNLGLGEGVAVGMAAGQAGQKPVSSWKKASTGDVRQEMEVKKEEKQHKISKTNMFYAKF